MDTALGLGLGHALHAMTAAFVAKMLENLVAADTENDFLEAALLAGTEGDVLHLPPHIACIMGVHAVKVAREETGLVATSSSADFEDNAGKVLARIDQQQIFEPIL